MVWIWLFVFYSFLGYLLEKWFAAAVDSRSRVRKGMVLLPLCPVYGLGMLAVLALPQWVKAHFWLLVLLGGAVATAVEYAVHWGYERLAGVRFWDYSTVRGNLNGRICLPFGVIWGVLTAAAVHLIQPTAYHLAMRIPAQVSYGMVLLLAADSVISLQVLRRSGDIDLMSFSQLRRYLQQQ